MRLQFENDELRDFITGVVHQVLVAIDWPQGRIALTEAEAAQACGVARHVLRDLRLAGRLKGRRLGRKVVYLREDLLRTLGEIKPQHIIGSPAPRSSNPRTQSESKARSHSRGSGM
jgi:hypothetical protein